MAGRIDALARGKLPEPAVRHGQHPAGSRVLLCVHLLERRTEQRANQHVRHDNGAEPPGHLRRILPDVLPAHHKQQPVRGGIREHPAGEPTPRMAGPSLRARILLVRRRTDNHHQGGSVQRIRVQLVGRLLLGKERGANGDDELGGDRDRKLQNHMTMERMIDAAN